MPTNTLLKLIATITLLSTYSCNNGTGSNKSMTKSIDSNIPSTIYGSQDLEATQSTPELYNGASVDAANPFVEQNNSFVENNSFMENTEVTNTFNFPSQEGTEVAYGDVQTRILMEFGEKVVKTKCYGVSYESDKIVKSAGGNRKFCKDVCKASTDPIYIGGDAFKCFNS